MTDNRKSIIKALLASVSIFLIAALIVTSYGSVFGVVAAYGSKYISEVQVFSGDSLDNAVQNCEAAGYTAVKKNINHSASGDIKDNGIYVVGYKTTENADEGITGISMLQMNGGYQDYTYGDVAEKSC